MNFGRMAKWPKAAADGGVELEMYHCFFASYHASGPQDNAGESPLTNSTLSARSDKGHSHRQGPAHQDGRARRPREEGQRHGERGRRVLLLRLPSLVQEVHERTQRKQQTPRHLGRQRRLHLGRSVKRIGRKPV